MSKTRAVLRAVGAAAVTAAIIGATPALASAATGTLILRDTAGRITAFHNPPAGCTARDTPFNYVANRLDKYVVAYDSPFCWGTATHIAPGEDRQLTNLNRSILVSG